MITLKTLPQATAQEVFDQVALHLLTQNKQSAIQGNKCRYRLKGLKCAAGCLIGDDEYKLSFESRTWPGLVRSRKVPFEHYELITRLQYAHDHHSPNEWEDELKLVASDFKLNTKIFNDKRIKK